MLKWKKRVKLSFDEHRNDVDSDKCCDYTRESNVSMVVPSFDANDDLEVVYSFGLVWIINPVESDLLSHEPEIIQRHRN